MRVLTANRSLLTTRNVTWRQVPFFPPVPSKQLLPIAKEGESTAREDESGEGTSSQGRGRVEVDLDGESDLDVTEVEHVLPVIRKTQTAGAGAGAGGVAEGASSASSVSFRRADSGISSITDSNSSSSSSNTDNDDDKSGNSTNSGDIPALAGGEAHRQRWNGKIPALQGGRTRSQSKQYQMSLDTADALLAHAERILEENTAIERVHGLPLEERLEEKHKWFGEITKLFEEDGPPLERHEEELDSDCPLKMVAEQNPELSIPSPIGKQPSEVESLPLSAAGVEWSVYRKGWEEAMKSEFDGHTKTGTFSMVDRVPKGRKPISSKWWFGCKTDHKGKITKLKARLVARGLTQIRDVDYTHSSSPCPFCSNEKGLPLRHFDVARAYIRASLDEEVYMKLPGGCGEQSKRTAKSEWAQVGSYMCRYPDRGWI